MKQIRVERIPLALQSKVHTLAALFLFCTEREIRTLKKTDSKSVAYSIPPFLPIDYTLLLKPQQKEMKSLTLNESICGSSRIRTYSALATDLQSASTLQL